MSGTIDRSLQSVINVARSCRAVQIHGLDLDNWAYFFYFFIPFMQIYIHILLENCVFCKEPVEGFTECEYGPAHIHCMEATGHDELGT